MDEHFVFESAGVRLIGRLHRPVDNAKAAIVVTGPLTSVKEQASGAYARALAQHGYTALAFDHRYFGESSGEPRQFENPNAKIEDIAAASLALQRDPRTTGLPLFAVGVCAGGGYMAGAVASVKEFKGFAGVAGYYSDPNPASIDAAQSKIARARAAEKKWQTTHIADTIPAVAPDGGDVGMPLREAYEYYGTARGAVPNYVNGYAVQSFAYTIPFNAVSAAAKISVPTLMIHSEKALAPSLARKFFATLNVPSEALWLQSQGQIDFYDDPKLIAESTAAIARWFDRHSH